MSAFGYFGSKLRLAAKLSAKLPPHNCWVELFCGSAAMTLAKDPAPIEIINDINEEIVNFYAQLRTHGSKLLKQIELTPYARVELERARVRAGHSPVSNLERARRFFVTAMMAVNGSFGSAQGGFSVSNSYSRNGLEARVNRWRTMPSYLAEVIERLKNVRVEKRDAIKLFSEFSNRPATLVYADPPYLAERVQGYEHDANTEEFHREFLSVALRAKCMLFISGYHSPLYNQLLTKERGWSKRIFHAITKGNNGKCFPRREVVWFNRAFVEANRTGRIPIRLSRNERKNRKVNPTRA
jgi:DNA adenine methylase